MITMQLLDIEGINMPSVMLKELEEIRDQDKYIRQQEKELAILLSVIAFMCLLIITIAVLGVLTATGVI